MTAVSESDNEYAEYLKSLTLSWKRPKGPPWIWRIVEGREKMENGEIPRFSIQEVPEELENDVVDFMLEWFLSEEPTSVDTGMADDPLAIRDNRTMWKDVVRQGVSVVALMVNSDPAAKPVIAGVDVLGVISAEDETTLETTMQFRSEGMKKVMGMHLKLVQETDVMKRYGVDRYLAALGLSVHPSFRGQGLGQEILQARDDIGLTYKIPVTETVFTATASQILAARAGYEVLLEKKYSEILDDEGKVAFPGVTVEFVKVMGKRLY